MNAMSKAKANMNVIETIKARRPGGNKLQAELIHDQDAITPREWHNLGTILIDSRLSHWIASRDSVVDTSIPLGNNPYEHWENLRREQLKLKKSDIAIAYPIIQPGHDNIRLSLGYEQGWGYDVVGFVYATKEQLRTWYSTKRITKSIIERAENCIQAELGTLTAWINGDCYGWQVKEYAMTDDGLDWEEVGMPDACWGYFDKECALDDMKYTLTHLTKTL